MTPFQKWLRILLPEVQLIDYIKQHGIINKKKRAQKTAGSIRANTISPAMSGPQTVLRNETASSSPISRGAVKEATFDAKKGIQQLRTNTSNNSLDDTFEKIKDYLKANILEQERFIEDLTTGYKKGFLNRKTGIVQQVILSTGPEGTGKRTTLILFIEQLYQHRLIPYRKVMEIDLSNYTEADIHTNFITDIAAAFEYGIGTVCFKGIATAPREIAEYIYHLVNRGYFRTNTGVLVDASDYYLVFSLDGEYHTEQEALSNFPKVIAENINLTAITEPLSYDALKKITRRFFATINQHLLTNTGVSVHFSEEVVAFISDNALQAKSYSYGARQWIKNDILSSILDLRAKSIIAPRDQIHLTYQDNKIVTARNGHAYTILQITVGEKESLEQLLAELESLIGLDSVKTFVKEMMDTVKIQKRRKESGRKDVPLTLHMIFSGNPGTGKTTVARLIGRVLKAMGILSSGQLVETSRQDIVGQYVGSTAPKTNAKIQEARGGVLFIDEAYTLSRNSNDPFGQEAIDTLVKGMEDYREEMVIILAGYTKEMEDFLKSNPGLPSRFPFQVEFPDYTPLEMLEIARLMATARDYVIDDEAEKSLVDLFAKKQVPGRNDSGNGRLVRNLLEEAIRKQSARLSDLDVSSEAALNLLTAQDFGITEETPFQLEERLDHIIGLENVKTFLRTLEKQIMVNNRRKEAGIQVVSEQNINMIFSGNPGTGKTTIARYVADMLKHLGVIKKGHLVEVGRTELVAGYVGKTAEKTKDVVNSALGGVLFIDEAYALVDKNGGGFGEEAINELVRLVEIHKDNLVVILAGYTDDMEDFLKVNPGLASRFPLHLEFDDYTPEEIVQITSLMAKVRGFTIREDVLVPLREWYSTKQVAGKKDVGNGRLARNKLEEAIRKQAVRIADEIELTNEELTLLTSFDFDLEDKEVKHSASEELERIIGLDNVKTFVKSLFAQIEMNQRRKLLGLPDMGSQSLHMVFKGNPGTGKTTIARIVAKRLKELNVIKSDILVETDRSGLVAGYVGQTALKTKDVIEKALGGVLFIDEAYSLASDSFGRESIDTLVKAMEDYKDELVVIVAGYNEDMEKFLTINAGLRSRFPNIITFPDYNPKEMLKISRLVFHEKGYKASKAAEETLLDLFTKAQEKSDSGNGRYVRNCCEQAIRKHALRLSGNLKATYEELTTVESEDIVDGRRDG